MAKLNTICGLVQEGDRLDWCVVKRGKDQLEQVKAGAKDLGGDGQDGPVLFSDLLESLRADKSAGIPKNVTMAMSASRALIRVVELPTVDASEITDMVELQVDKFSPFPMDALSIAHEVIAQDEERSHVLIAAVQAAEVEVLGDVINECGCKLARVDLDILGWWDQLTLQISSEASGARLDVIADADRLHMIVSSAGRPLLFRTMDLDPELERNDLVEDIVTEVRYALTAREARNLPTLTEGGFWYSGREYFDLGAIIGGELGIQLDPKEAEQLGSVAEAIASRSLLQNGTGLDLSLRTWHEEKLSRQARKKLIKAAVGILATWLGFLSIVYGAVFFEGYKVRKLGKANLAIKAQVDEATTMRRRIRILEMYQRRDNSALECLRLMSARLPAGVELGRMTYDREEPLVIRGVAQAAEAIYQLRDALRNEPLFLSVDLSGSIIRGSSGEQFEMDVFVDGMRKKEEGP